MEDSKTTKGSSAMSQPDPYEVLSVSRGASDKEITAAYKRLALKYHPDKNANSQEASELFMEVALAYNILSDPEKKRMYDSFGFEALGAEKKDVQVDLQNLGPGNAFLAAIFSKLGVPIKTTVSVKLLDKALKGIKNPTTLDIGKLSGEKHVEKHHADYYKVEITQEQADSGVVVRVTSDKQSKFKLLYFVRDVNAPGYSLSLQEDSEKNDNVTSAGMYFLHFQVYRMDSTASRLVVAKDPETAFFRKLDGLKPCEVLQIGAGSHIFAVYGDNFFTSASYEIEVLCAKEYEETTNELKDIEAQILKKRNELREFEDKYREAQDVIKRYSEEKKSVDDMLKQRDRIFSDFTTRRSNASEPSANYSSGIKRNKFSGDSKPGDHWQKPYVNKSK